MYFQLLVSIWLLALTIPLNVSAHSPEAKTVLITQDGFSPQEITIQKGQEVIFGNSDIKPHWPASDIHPTHLVYPEFDAKEAITPGRSWAFRFTKAGTWSFHDHLNPNLKGKIVVEDKVGTGEGEDYYLGPSWGEKVKRTLLRLYYGIFKNKLEEKLGGKDMLQIVSSEKDLDYWMDILGIKGMNRVFTQYIEKEAITGCHDEAHKLGAKAYAKERLGAFKEGMTVCYGGYYHGVLEGYLADKGGVIPSEGDQFCSSFKSKNDLFSCYHGLGHAYLIFEDYDLPQAIKDCGGVKEKGNQTSCWDGVFMENTLSAAGMGGKTGHVTRWISDDINFPCNSLEKDPGLELTCWHDQVSRYLWREGYDFKKGINYCASAKSEEKREICFVTLGMETANITQRDEKKMLAICDLSPQKYLEDCYRGAVEGIVEYWGTNVKEEPHVFCSLVGKELKPVCFRMLGQWLAEIFGKNDSRAKRGCGYTPEFENFCLEGVSAD